MSAAPLSPALQLRRLTEAAARLHGAGEPPAVDVVLDLYWIFVRHTPGWDEFRRRPDLGKWLLRLPADQETVLAHLEALLPRVKDGTVRLAKITNLATPRAADGATLAAYCASADRDAVRRVLETELGWHVAWKTNQETFARLAARTPPRH